MKLIVGWLVVLTGIALFNPEVKAQERGEDKSKEALAKLVLQSMELSHTLKTMVEDEKSSLSPDLKQRMKQRIPRVISSEKLVGYCVENFALEELKTLNDYYQSPAGKKRTEAKNRLFTKIVAANGREIDRDTFYEEYLNTFTDAEWAEIDDFLKTPAAKKIEKKEEALVLLGWNSLFYESFADIYLQEELESKQATKSLDKPLLIGK
jgi:hypothetical protein